ncbi:MAG: rhomboid family intramembrane serine protease [Flavobacterium sp.]
MNNKLLPHYIIEFELNETDKPIFIQSIEFAFKQLGWDIVSLTENKIEGHTSLSLSSYGESITIDISATKVTIESKCVGNQLFDWGKNKKNVESLLEQIKIYEQTEFEINEVTVSETSKNDFESISNNKSSFKDYLQVFIPTKDYFFTPILIFLNILVFVVMAIDGTNIVSPESEDLLKWGANDRTATLNGEFWRLFSCVFVHIGIVHLILNLYALIFIGSILEPIIGKYKFIVGYLISGFIASTASLWWHTAGISAGASGAIFGLFGIFLALLTTNYLNKSTRKSMLIYIFIYIGFNLMNGLNEGIDNAAHLGGLVSGFIFGYAFYYGLINKESKVINQWILGVITFLGISCSFLVLQKIPNPIEKYKKVYGDEISYFDIYEIKMKDFELNESLALEIQNQSDLSKESMLNYIDNHTLYYWTENLKIVKEIEKFSLPKETLERNDLIKKYVLLRIKQAKLIKQRIKTDSEKIDKKIIEINQEIDNMVETIVNL